MDTKVLETIALALVALITHIVTSKVKSRQFKHEKELAFYKVQTETLTVQREMLTSEETELRAMLREELDRCRLENGRLDKELEELKRRLLNIEMELRAWELGLKVPRGFELIQLDNIINEEGLNE
jgi:uncharacterized protein HemX